MAGDWIKVEKNTPHKPEISLVMRVCRCTRAEAFLGFFEVWNWLDDITADGEVPFVDRSEVDVQANIPGFAEAMEQAGWLVFHRNGGFTVRNWERHNGKSAKARGLTQKRVAALRNSRTASMPDFPADDVTQ
jgi:hypothetical protein